MTFEEKGIETLLFVLDGIREMIQCHAIKDVKCVATATIRQAKNKDAINHLVKEKTGFDIRILTE